MTKAAQFDWKCPVYVGLCPTAIDWAQMAAYIDGEGSILINTQHGREGRGFYLRITVANTDVRLVQWCKETFGGSFKDANTDKYYEGKNWKRSYHWGCSSHRAAWVLYNCQNYFHLKFEQALIGLELQESLTKNQFCGRANPIPQAVRNDRQQLKQRLLVLKAKGINGVPVPSGPVAKTA